MIHSAYKLNKQSDNKQPWCTPFPFWNQFTSSSDCCFLTCIQVSQNTGKVIWYSHLLKNFSVCCDPHSQWLLLSNEAEVNVFLEFPCFLHDSLNVDNLISGSYFSKCILYIWKFLIHILLKPSLKEFGLNLASMWNEYNCAIVWTFFGISFLWNWDKNWPFPVLWPLLSFPNLLAFWVQHFNSIIF